MDPAILLMLTVEKRFETRHQDYSWWCHRDDRIPLGGGEKRFEIRRQEYMPRWDEPENVEPQPQRERTDLFKRILYWIRPQQSCGCLDTTAH